MSNKFNEITISFLEKIGYTEKEQRKFSGNTRLFHDLRWFGDDAEELTFVLTEFGVNLEGFKFQDYFPAEYPSKFPLIYSLVPIPRKFFEDTSQYKPLTLAMINRILLSGKWSSN